MPAYRPLFNVTDDHTYSYAGVRGISQPGDYRPRLQILIDGMSVNENIFASAPVDSVFPLDIGLIERIEVIRGPSASVYGGDAMFGVINVVTRSGQSVGSEASLSLGSGANRRLRASWGGQVGGNDVLISATGFDVNGRTLAFNDVNGDGSSRDLHRVDGEDGGQLFFKVRGDDWHLSFTHAKRNRIVPTASYDTIADMLKKMAAIPNGKGLGVFYWEPESYNGWQSYSLGLMDNSGKPTYAMDAFLLNY